MRHKTRFKTLSDTLEAPANAGPEFRSQSDSHGSCSDTRLTSSLGCENLKARTTYDSF